MKEKKTVIDKTIYPVNSDIYKGIYYRKHPTRKHGIKFDRYFMVRYTINGKRVWEGIGWESEGYTAKDTYETFLILKNNRKTEAYPQTFKELKESEKKKNLERLILNQFWKIYYEQSKITKKESSYEREEQLFRLYITPILGDMFLDEITAVHYQRVLENVLKRSPRTQEYTIGTLRRILLKAWDLKYLKKEPDTLRSIKIKKVNNERERLITKEEKKFILSEIHTKSIPAYNITQFSFLTGCRFGEASNLKWIDIAEDRIKFRNTKNKKHRTIELSHFAKNLLSEIKKTGEYVFTMSNSKQWKSSPFTFETVCKSLNKNRETNDKIVFHSIRHYVATQLAKHLTLKELMDTLGWTTPEMALRYMKPDPIRQKRALDRLGDIVNDTDQIENVIELFKTT